MMQIVVNNKQDYDFVEKVLAERKAKRMMVGEGREPKSQIFTVADTKYKIEKMSKIIAEYKRVQKVMNING